MLWPRSRPTHGSTMTVTTTSDRWRSATGWIERQREFTYTRALAQAAPSDEGTWLIVNHLEGNFPGGEVDLRYQFVLDGEQISELLIAP